MACQNRQSKKPVVRDKLKVNSILLLVEERQNGLKTCQGSTSKKYGLEEGGRQVKRGRPQKNWKWEEDEKLILS